MSNSELGLTGLTAEDYLKRPEYASIARALEQRQSMADGILRHCKSVGLDVDRRKILRHYDLFYRWHISILATGYLIKELGIKYKPGYPKNYKIR